MMPATYERADASVMAVVKETMREYHDELRRTEVKICVLMATAEKNDKGEPLAPAVKLHGVACAAVVKIIPYKQRAAGREDAEITIDADLWEKNTEAERIAIIDHELNHLKIVRDDEGAVRSDDCGRPKLKMVPHDHDFGWFNVIARRHGDSSYEVQQAKAFADKDGQCYFGWKVPPGEISEVLPAAKVRDEDVRKATFKRGKRTGDDGHDAFTDRVADVLTGAGLIEQ